MNQPGPWFEKSLSYRVKIRLVGGDWQTMAGGFATHEGAENWGKDVFEEGVGLVAGYLVERELEDGSWKGTVSVERGSTR